ncbi:hypothetical protein UPYG_G00319220 [Umbra pygmaea]|uniref:Uncharacterized protein n=1 Tax=Umbra pygmaea TaxID=75934 RepID=A0ABD0WNF1_UMBPY
MTTLIPKPSGYPHLSEPWDQPPKQQCPSYSQQSLPRTSSPRALQSTSTSEQSLCLTDRSCSCRRRGTQVKKKVH